MERLGVGIIGCGSVAEEYVKAFEGDPRSQVRALVSRRLENAQRYRDRYKLSCAQGTDAASILAREDVDIVVVCTPHSLHTEHVVAAAEAGKHVIVEKPMALSWADTQKQQQAATQARVKTLVSYVLHWNPLLMTIDHLIEQGAFGHIFMIEVTFSIALSKINVRFRTLTMQPRPRPCAWPRTFRLKQADP